LECANPVRRRSGRRAARGCRRRCGKTSSGARRRRARAPLGLCTATRHPPSSAAQRLPTFAVIGAATRVKKV